MRKIAMKLLYPIILLCVYTTTYAQQPTVSGRVQDEKGKPIPFATVSLLTSPDLKLVTATVTDSIGQFTIEPREDNQKYLLKITAIGLTEKRTEEFTGAKNFGVLSLTPEGKTLSDVTITALRPTVEQRADRMIVNVEGTAMAAGSNAYSVLSKAPGVFIDHDGNIQLNGRSGVVVQIDGRPTYLSARDLRNLLEGMAAENLKNIEIITNPSSKQDAEGTSGILNINLKKNTQRGINGSVYANYSYNFFDQSQYSAGGNLNYKGGRWNSFINTDFQRRSGGREATFTRIFYGNTTTYFDQTAVGNFVAIGPPQVRAGTDYSFNNKHSIGRMVYYNTNTADIEFLTDTYIGNAPKSPNVFIDADNITRNTFTNFTTNLHYVGKLDTLGTQLTTDLDYVRITNRGIANLYNLYTDLSNNQETIDNLYQETPNGYSIYSARIDFAMPMPKGHKIETGVKASKVTSDNNFKFYFNNNGLVLDPLRTNHFYYKEYIYAGYVNWNATLSDKVSIQTGLRAEQTTSRGTSFTTGQVTPRRYFDIFPTVFVQHKVSDNYGINYSYGRRLTRPNYGNLNPFRAYRDPYTWYEGNPYLRPTYTHSFSIAQSIKKVYIITATYQLNKDIMSEVPILDVDNALTIYTTGNVDDSYNASLTAVGPLKFGKKWDSQNTILLSYSNFEMTSSNGTLENNRLFLMLQSNHTLQLPSNYRLEVNMLYRGPSAYGLYKMASMHRVDVAIKKSILNKKLDITLNAGDIFKGWRFLWTTDINGNVNDFDQYFRIRNIGLSLRYNFSKGQKVEQRKTTNLEELNRTGG